MTRFDDLFTAGQPADGLADELRRMLAVRETDITEPARPALDGDRLQLPAHRSHRISELPGGRTGTLLAAAVVALLVLGSAFAVRGLNHRNSGPAGQPALSTPTPRPTPSPTRTGTTNAQICPLPASWATALGTGLVAVDQPQNRPVSAGPDGTFLMMQTATGQVGGQTDFTHDELAIFDRNGHGTTIWTAADPAHDLVDVSTDSATSTDWVVYGLTRSQNLAAHGVAAWNRTTGQSMTIRLLSAAEQAANTVIDFDPIVVGGTAYWIEQKYGDDAHQTLVSQPLPAGLQHTTSVTKVNRLIAVGTGVGLLTGTGGIDATGFVATLAAGPGLILPTAVQSAAEGGGYSFSWDGTVLHWMTDQARVSWTPGQPTVTRAPLNAPPGTVYPVGPFATETYAGEVLTDAVRDTRNGAVVRLPTGTTFALVTDGDLITITGTTKFGGTRVHRVPLAALPPTHC